MSSELIPSEFRLPYSVPNKDKSSFILSQKLLELDGIGVGYLSCGPAHFPNHSNPTLKIGIPLRHSSLHVQFETPNGEKKHQLIKQGSVSIIPPNLNHEAWLENQMEIIVIRLAPHLLEQVADDSQGCSIEIEAKLATFDPLIRQLGLSLFREFENGVPGNLYVESLGHILATHILRHYSIQKKICDRPQTRELSQRKLRQAIDYLNENLSQDIKIAELANLVEMNQYQFARTFKDLIGISPHKYLLTRRVEEAKELLSRTKLSIAEISYHIGFSSQSHFTSTFRRFTGTTPAFYRKSF